ncbi:hypothetical protein ASPVEDRAFT_26261 [Aspergillus versicolor CBS 583.65]|uniref:DSBA-like thioredoxin domain-containing protein n=1 Tax=Aspergillus versicolor CBS 583.65 TaxID=1036611 RepID=A0A1L9PD32_ASPVE|nr:uncharacterized protein ASPVEDRAFT_26261 [Aspergillus versicolor CBS 583.65]OJI99447.1 hypothetical protein ASPVEDRAFT_26261 [Aspergillus versicolor CBS 583.65]
MAVIPIEIISDVICPWCFIGYRSLQRTIALYKKTYPGGSKDEFQIVWKPYFIDQVAPEESVLVNETDRMARRMTPAQITAAQTRLIRVGKSVGIAFRFGGYIGSSRLAHRVLHFALERGGSEIQCAVAETLFKYQFEMEQDVSDVDVVVNAAVGSGLDESEVRAFLAGGGGVEETENEAKGSRAQVQGVPHFVIGEKNHLDGAGEMEEFFQAFVAARAGMGKTTA